MEIDDIIFKSIYWSLVIVSIIIIFTFLWERSESYKLTDYSCEQIEQSLITGDCLILSKTWIFEYCYDIESVKVSYELRCLNETGG